jgi:hypothetical protein
MKEISNPTVLYLKGALFLVLGGVASGLLVAMHPSLTVLLLLAVAVWAFARAYYFAFYVLQHYIDSEYRFAGLVSLVKFLLRRRTSGRGR